MSSLPHNNYLFFYFLTDKVTNHQLFRSVYLKCISHKPNCIVLKSSSFYFVQLITNRNTRVKILSLFTDKNESKNRSVKEVHPD